MELTTRADDPLYCTQFIIINFIIIMEKEIQLIYVQLVSNDYLFVIWTRC